MRSGPLLSTGPSHYPKCVKLVLRTIQVCETQVCQTHGSRVSYFGAVPSLHISPSIDGTTCPADFGPSSLFPSDGSAASATYPLRLISKSVSRAGVADLRPAPCLTPIPAVNAAN